MIYQSFVEFVNTQPADRVINHTSWEACAIGDWVAGDDQEQDRETDFFFDQTMHACSVIGEANPTLHDILNCHGEVFNESAADGEDEYKTIETYGDLQAYLNGTF